MLFLVGLHFKDHHILKGLGKRRKHPSKHLLGVALKVNHQFYHDDLEVPWPKYGKYILVSGILLVVSVSFGK